MIRADPISEVAHEANGPGEVSEPAQLLKLLVNLDNPIDSLLDLDMANRLFEALYNEFGFIRNVRLMGASLQPVERQQWVALLRWLIRELWQWRNAADVRRAKLIACFIVAQASDYNDQLWRLLPDDCGDNGELSEALKRLIGSFAIEFTSPDPNKEPIWEREAVERFKLADAQGDWAEIGESWGLFEHLIFGNILQTQAVRCLFRCGIERLVEASAHMRQTAVPMQIASALSIDQRLELAVASANPYLQFGCIYHTLSGRQSARSLSSEEERLLTTLLLNVAADGPRWIAWMHLFNAYPVRYPALQTSLGQALAHAPESAIEAYVNSIVLHATPAKREPGRSCVAECLRKFRASATPERRHALWKCAYERWLTWRFDEANRDTHILGINWSKLDYAIVGFACECMDHAARAAAMDKVRSELQNLDDAWHVSVTDVYTAWNRLLSQFQPYAHAAHAITSEEDWLPEPRTYWPFDPSKEKYLILKYRTL